MSSVKSYTLGYALSVLLTLLAFGVLSLHVGTALSAALFVVLALLQLVVQLFFFLHIGKGKNKYWNAVALGFALFIVTVLVGGTLWIMSNIKHTPQNNFLNGQVNVQNEND